MIKLKSIKSKLLIAFLTVDLLSVGVFGYLNIRSTRSDLEEEIVDKLLLLAEAKEGQIFAYLDGIESRTLDFSSDGFIRDSLKEIVKRRDSKQVVEVLNNHLVVNKKSLDPTLHGILVLDLKGKVVAATDEEEIGADESQDEYFQEGLKGVFTKELEEHEHFDQQYIFVVSAPLIDKETGELLGVLLNFFEQGKLESVFSGQFQIEKGALTSTKGRSQTLEVYLVNREKKMFVHPERSKYQHASQMTVDTAQVRGCLDNKEEMRGKYPNYAGEEVIGASMCFIERGWVLLAEISTDEAFLPIVQMQRRMGITAGVFAVLIVLITLFFADSFSRPIKKLREATEVIAQGNLDYRVDVKTGDEVEQLAGAFNDMTAKLQQKIRIVQEEQAKLTASIKSLFLGFIMVDNDNNIVLTNPALEKIFGRSDVSMDWISKQLGGKFNLPENCQKCREEKKILDVKDVEYGSKFLRVFLAPVVMVQDHEEVIGIVILMEDITEAKILERSKDEFFSIASHELRTPLTAIQGNTSLIQQFYGEKLKKDKDLWEMIEDVRESAIRLISIVNDFLDVSRLEMGKIQFKNESFDLAALTQDVVKEYQATATAKNLYLKLEEPKVKIPLAFADYERTKQVLINLIGNGIKFSDEGGVILQIQPSGQFVRILVSDTGRGISKDGQKLLFRKFQQTGKNIYTRDVVQGTGLGLYISKLIVEGMGGKIGLEKTEEGKGSTFVVELPTLAKKS